MMPPDLSGGNCQKFALEELEETFWYPGPQGLGTAPSAASLERWEEAKEVCIECPIFLRCREASWGQDFGVYGGTDQYERYLYRRKLQRHLARKTEGERAALAAYFHARYAGGLGDAPEVMGRLTGYSHLAIKAMISEHEAVLDAQREQRLREAPVRPLADWGETPEFPAESPRHGDGWVWYFGRAHKGHYVAETADGAYVRMKVKPAMAQTTKWLPASHVDLRRAVDPVIQDWIGRPDGVQESAQDDQRPGKQAADAA
jgi:hypothetical protein